MYYADRIFFSLINFCDRLEFHLESTFLLIFPATKSIITPDQDKAITESE